MITSNNEDPSAALSIQLLSTNPATFAAGQMLWINLSFTTIQGRVGDQEILLQPDATLVMAPPRPDAGDYSVSLTFTVGEDEFIHPLCETTWGHDPRSRSLVVASTIDNRRVPQVSAFSDFRQEPP